MSAPFRIVAAPGRPRRLSPTAGAPPSVAESAPREPSPELRSYLDRLLKLIPGEVVGLYLVGSGLIPAENPSAALIWALFCLAGVVAVRVFGTADPPRAPRPQWGAVAIAVVSFGVWVYSLGGASARLVGYVPWLGSLLVLAWTFVVPLVYRGEGSLTEPR